MRNITMAQIRVVPGRPDINCQTMLDAIATAKEQGGKIVIFPSMALTSSLLGDTWQYEHFAADAKKYGQKIIAASDGITVVYGNVAGSSRTKLYIAAFVAQNGRLIGGKAEYDGAVAVQRNLNWLDKRYFTPAAEEPQPAEIMIDGKKHSFVFLMGEDILLTPKSTKVDFIFYLNNRVFTWSKTNYAAPLWANRMQACLLQVNMVGMQNIGKTVYAMPGGSSVYNQRGEKIKLLPLWQPEIYTLPFTPRTAKTQETEENEWGYFTPGAPKITSIYNAIVFSIREFMQSIGKQRVVIGLSGGIDSAVSACLFTQALGAEHVLLVNLPSRNNSDTTKKCAYQLAQELGCHYTSIPIEDSVLHTGEQINQTIVTDLANGKEEKLHLNNFMIENVQARDRGGRLLPAISAAWDAVFSCNGNKAEATAGYFTLYGDGTGFFAPIGDLWKWQVYQLAEYIQTEIYQKPLLQDIMNLPPSAELSPAQDVEKGLGDPLCYPYHDRLFASWVDWSNPAGLHKLLTWYTEGILGEKLNCEDPTIVYRLFPTAVDFIRDLEKWWTNYNGLAMAKKMQLPPILNLDSSPYRCKPLAMPTPYFPLEYLELKEKILKK